ncbi:MAG: MFS transporter [Candidatus Bathyarchaeota archaeon]|nr:MFS transporter [Candidatus Bathyarchaeota archaeon]MDD4325905.1 MFS transporter [Candidatus Bathyarchaeota archaeon]MDI9577181.1 MFS transporter [Thermoproteota archaeon]MDT8782026.1 MFS transporter [Candidatus Bathyarchaeota archaeon]NLD66604.1 MFS transporter [Thermoproteota archaeon]
MRISKLFRGDQAVLRGNFLLITITWIIMFFAIPIPDTYASLYYLHLGADELLLSIMAFTSSIAVALVQFPGGYLADKHGRRWLIITMTIGIAVGSLFFVFAPSWHFIMIGLLIQNICSMYGPALMAMVMDSLPPQNRGAGFSFQSVITTLVLLPAPIIAQYLVVTFEFDLGMRIAYSITTIAYFIIAIVRLKLKETLPQTDETVKPNFIDALKHYPKAVKEGIYVWRKVPKSAYNLFWSIIIVNGLVISCQTYFVVYATSKLGISLEQWATVIAFRYLTIAIPAILAGFSMDTLGRKRFLIIGYLLYIPGMLLFVNADFNVLLLAFFFFGLGNLLQLNSHQVLMGDLVPKNLRGTVTGCLQFFMFIMQGIMQIIIGLIYVYVSPQLPFIIFALSMIPISIFVFKKIQEPKIREP